MNDNISKHLCPVCNSPLNWCEGGKLTKDGITMYCINLQCTAQEVFSHANKESECFELIKQKYCRTSFK